MIEQIFAILFFMFSGSLLCYLGVDIILDSLNLSVWESFGCCTTGVFIILVGTAFFVMFTVAAKLFLDELKERKDNKK